MRLSGREPTRGRLRSTTPRRGLGFDSSMINFDQDSDDLLIPKMDQNKLKLRLVPTEVYLHYYQYAKDYRKLIGL